MSPNTMPIAPTTALSRVLSPALTSGGHEGKAVAAQSRWSIVLKGAPRRIQRTRSQLKFPTTLAGPLLSITSLRTWVPAESEKLLTVNVVQFCQPPVFGTTIG